MVTGSGTGTPVDSLVTGSGARCYCSIADVRGFGDVPEAELLAAVRQASAFIEGEIGVFIPITETRYFDGDGTIDLWTGPLLAVTTISDDGDALSATDYIPYPLAKWWENGPYTRLRVDPDATGLSVWTREEEIVEIAGRWGLWEKAEVTGATVANDPLSSSGTSLIVSDGSKVRPGMVLKIDTEQLFVSATGSASNATSLLNGAVAASDTQITVDDGTEFNVGEFLQVGTEDFRILAIGGNNLQVARAQNGTERQAHLNDAQVKVYRTYTVERGANGTTAAAHTNATSISRYVAPWDIKYLCQQIATLMRRKAESDYAGKTASVELGEVYYHSEFPKDVIRQIKRKYRIVE